MATSRQMHATRLSAAELDQRITIQARLTAQDERGQESAAWNAGFTVWARVRPTSGREYVAANAVQSQNNVTFTTRYLKQLYGTIAPDYTAVVADYFAADYVTGSVASLADLRILWKGQPYDVIEPPADIDGGHYALEFVCSGGRPGVAV